MSDDLSMNNFMVLQDAALDASLRRISMQNAAQRNTQGNGAAITIAVEKAPTPVSRNGFVMGRVFLQHKPSRVDCSVRHGRAAETLEYTDRKGYDSFRARMDEELTHHKNTRFRLCPECYPSAYEEWTSNEDQRLMQAICNSGRFADELPLDEGYYLIRESDTVTLSYAFKTPTKARIFHMSGYGCCANHSRTLMGPYKGVNDAFESVDMGVTHNGIVYLPCPKCFCEVVYTDNKSYASLFEMLTLDLALSGFFPKNK
ncbi:MULTISPECIES: hypothetical protein [unclassified Oscillibacter]|uniref:hypothetical protein n=1 Tax=unclassified Oscillibacter TaxID=2629304 RepID=UPI0025E10DFE|nr:MULTISPECIES: hypothetical protein [unclassified Oscillibacter]